MMGKSAQHYFSAKNSAGFTLIELLVVIGILAVLSSVVVITLNPAEIFKQARDAKRLSEITTLNKALGIVSLELPASALGTPNTIYISVPDPALTGDATSNCGGIAGMPSPPSGFQYRCVSSANFMLTDGKGWVPVNFTSLSAGSPLSALPIDPVNSVSSGFYYAYVPGGSYVLTAALESQKRIQEVAMKDGGSDPSRVEKGTNVSLWNSASGLLAYWKFDETNVAVNTVAADSSGNGNDGIYTGAPPIVSTGKIGSALDASSNSYIEVSDSPPSRSAALFAGKEVTMAAWIKMNTGGIAAPRAIYSDYEEDDNPYAEYSFEVGLNKDSTVFHTNHYDGVSYTNNNRNTALSTALSDLIKSGDWVHIALTWNGNSLPNNPNNDNKVRSYINGVETVNDDAFAINPGDPSAQRNFYIGRRRDNTAGMQGYFRGKIDELRIYSRALSATEISLLYNATR